MKILGENWFIDTNNLGEGHAHQIEEIVIEKDTKYQNAVIAKLKAYGLALFLDEKIQSSEYDEFIFHESLVHPPMLFNANPKNIVVIGGGEGATLREVLKYKSVEKVTMVDIDPDVIEICRKFLPAFHQNSFQDPRVKLVIEDGRKFIKESDDLYDVAIIDLSEPLPDSPSYKLFTKEFYNLVKEKLTRNGTVSIQSGDTSLCELKYFSILNNTINSVFESVYPYTAFVPSYGALWGFSLAFKNKISFNILESNIGELISYRINKPLKYIDSITFKNMFYLPKYIRDSLEKSDQIYEDKNPMII